MPRTANKFPKTIAVPLEKWMAQAIQEAADANDRTPEQEIRARLREGLEPPAEPIKCGISSCEQMATANFRCGLHQLVNGTSKMSLGD